MSLIICKKKTLKPYKIKEVDVNIWSIEELCFYIHNFTILISSDFICNNLLYFIYTDLALPSLSNKLSSMQQKKASMADMLSVILDYSFLYSKEELQKFRANVARISSLNRDEQIDLAGDLLFHLTKYEKAIKLYEQLPDTFFNKYKKIAYAYAKLQNYDKAIWNFDKGLKILDKVVSTDNALLLQNARNDILKHFYFVCRLNDTKNLFDKYIDRINENLITDWDIEYVQIGIKVNEDYNLNSYDEMFVMDETYLRENINSIINTWKEKYRGLV